MHQLSLFTDAVIVPIDGRIWTEGDLILYRGRTWVFICVYERYLLVDCDGQPDAWIVEEQRMVSDRNRSNRLP